MLASSGHVGMTEAILLASGFSVELLVGMAQAGLVVVTTSTARAGASAISVPRLHITESGRKAIDGA
jgi:hypothetical protein